MARILVVEDEDNLRFSVSRSLERSGHTVEQAANLARARSLNAKHAFDLVLTDVMLGHESGLELLTELRGEGFDGALVVMTAYSNVGDAVKAMKDGADDYISKPLSLEELSVNVERWLEHRRLARRVKLIDRIEGTRERESGVVGESPRWRAALGLADRLAGLPFGQGQPGSDGGGASLPCILLTGETGVGKGVLARYIHNRAVQVEGERSGRAEKSVAESPFVHVNCSALPATLVEAELFGHEKGAFTDAREARHGLFELADGGTIFLDEISEMPLELQAKLLLVVEHGSFRRVGGTKERHVRVRVIAASNQHLEERVQAGTFRRDLLYRLNAFTISIPPLRERNGDALLIAEASLERLTRRYGRAPAHFSPGARDAIASHHWPGNVRELVNSVQRAVMLSDGPVIEPADLGLGAGQRDGSAFDFVPDHSPETGPDNGRVAHPDDAAAATLDHPRASASSGTALAEPAQSRTLRFDFEHGLHRAEDVERELIMQALRHTHGNVSRAAKLIGMQRSSLRYRIDRYKLESYVAEVAGR